MQDFTTANLEIGVATYVADQITLLCQRLMQVPQTVRNTQITDDAYEAQLKAKSDSDSDNSSRTNTPTHHIYTELDSFQPRNSIYTSPRQYTCASPFQIDGNSEEINQVGHGTRLNSVVLFSSDSEDECGFRRNGTKFYDTRQPNNGCRRSRSHKKKRTKHSKSPNYEILDQSTKDNSSIFGTKSNAKRIRPTCVRSPSPILYDAYEKQFKRETDSLVAPIKEYSKRMSPSCDAEDENKHHASDSHVQETNLRTKSKDASAGKIVVLMATDESSPSSARTTPKRLLPATPKQIADQEDENMHHNTASRLPTTYPSTRYRPYRDDTDASLAVDIADSISVSTANSTMELFDVASLPTLCHAEKQMQGNAGRSDGVYNNTDELLTADQHLLSTVYMQRMDNLQSPDNGTYTAIRSNKSKAERTPDPDYVDIEEIKFRESIRSTRREIIDKLKSKYTHSSNVIAHPIRTDADSQTFTRKFQTNLRKFDSICATDLEEIDNSSYAPYSNSSLGEERLPFTSNSEAKLAHNRELGSTPYARNNITQVKDVVAGMNASTLHQIGDGLKLFNESDSAVDVHDIGVYKSRVAYTYDVRRLSDYSKYSTDTIPRSSTSIVTSAIAKFEKALVKDPHNNIRPKQQKLVVKTGHGVRYRSASEHRYSGSSCKDNLRSHAKYASNHVIRSTGTNKGVLQQFQNVDVHGRENGEAICRDSTNLTKSYTEHDLLNLVSSQSCSSIRKQWTKRRSSSMAPRINYMKPSQGPTYEYWMSFSIPDIPSRCFVSAIIILDNRSIVLLDEMNSCLHLFDQAFKHTDQYRILDLPRGCVKVTGQTVAVAFPYKKCICTYCIQIGAILFKCETSVPCSEWIVDIGFARSVFYVLCKRGDIHILTETGSETNRVSIGMNGLLFIPTTEKRLYVMEKSKISKFSIDGTCMSSKADTEAHSMIIIDNRIYVADRQRHKLVPLSESTDVLNLTEDRIEYPLAICSTSIGDILLVSQFEESMDAVLTRTIKVLKLKRK